MLEELHVEVADSSNVEFLDENRTRTPAWLSDLRKVWILPASTGFMNGRRRFNVIEHLSETDRDTAINEIQTADEAEWSE